MWYFLLIDHLPGHISHMWAIRGQKWATFPGSVVELWYGSWKCYWVAKVDFWKMLSTRKTTTKLIMCIFLQKKEHDVMYMILILKGTAQIWESRLMAANQRDKWSCFDIPLPSSTLLHTVTCSRTNAHYLLLCLCLLITSTVVESIRWTDGFRSPL